MKQYEPSAARFYRDTESGVIVSEMQLYNEWDNGNYYCTFYQYLLNCTGKNGFLEEIIIKISGNECYGYTVTVNGETVKQCGYGGLYHTAAFGRLDFAEAVKANIEECFRMGCNIETVTKHFFEYL